MDKSYKLIRINESIRRELSKILSYRLRENIISIVRVETSPDLSQSKVYVSALYKPENALRHLVRENKAIWKELSKKIILRRLPKLMFIIDKEINDVIISGIPQDIITLK